ncbi:MAG: GNAT family N-acetyltransferase [Angustibacter sp.]
MLATGRAHQGRGLASAVIAPQLRTAAERGLPSCLETSTIANRRFYERRGFAVTATMAVPDGPPVWWMQRSPVDPVAEQADTP